MAYKRTPPEYLFDFNSAISVDFEAGFSGTVTQGCVNQNGSLIAWNEGGKYRVGKFNLGGPSYDILTPEIDNLGATDKNCGFFYGG